MSATTGRTPRLAALLVIACFCVGCPKSHARPTPEQLEVLQRELTQAAMADQQDPMSDGPFDVHVQAFFRKHGRNAVPLFEKLLLEVAESGDVDLTYEVWAAIKGLVLFEKQRARPVLERLADSPKAAFEHSRSALKALVGLAPEDEKLGLLVARLRAPHAHHPEDLTWTISDLMELGDTRAVPHLEAVRSRVSEERTRDYIDMAIDMLKDPHLCKLYSERRTPTGRWSCMYGCTGRTRSREHGSGEPCPITIPNPGR
ncbi:hypothetical protein ACLESD_32095 [Pyxidicoccus sp. 3LFB2]